MPRDENGLPAVPLPGDMTEAGRSLRCGYDIERTLAGLGRVDATLTALAVTKPSVAGAGRRRVSP